MGTDLLCVRVCVGLRPAARLCVISIGLVVYMCSYLCPVCRRKPTGSGAGEEPEEAGGRQQGGAHRQSDGGAAEGTVRVDNLCACRWHVAVVKRCVIGVCVCFMFV